MEYIQGFYDIVYSEALNGNVGTTGVHGITVFILACCIGYYVIWRVTPALHAPLMSVTNAVSSIIIVGAIFSLAHRHCHCSRILAFIAVFFTSINIFGGFAITHRMIKMFRKMDKTK
jgi:NAD(P) transhydrogenase subunit alpha